jgi:hypothetical protein
MLLNFFQKLNLATKTRRHKGKCVAFLLSAFAPLWQTFFRSEAEKKFLSFEKNLFL